MAISRSRLSLVVGMALTFSLLLAALPANVESARGATSEAQQLPNPKPRPSSLPDTEYEEALPGPGNDNPGRMPPPGEAKDLQRRSSEEVEQFERANNAKVIENEDGLFVFDVSEEGERTRVVATPERTSDGTPVVGLAFMDEDQIAEIEGRDGRNRLTNLLRLPAAYAHYAGHGHYHGMAKCSYVYQYANSWDLYV